MKNKNTYIFLTLIAIILSGCRELFPEETVIYEGRIFEAYDLTKPVDSVLVVGCTQALTLFPSWPDCDAKTFTDSDGRFYISFQADGLEGRGIRYSKEGYANLDSCITLADGSLQCYIEPIPTVFYIYSPTKKEPFSFDSLSVELRTAHKDTLIQYHTESFSNTQGGTSYYWTTDQDKVFDSFDSHTHILVPDNSEVSLSSNYFKDRVLTHMGADTFFCPKGFGNKYKILYR